MRSMTFLTAPSLSAPTATSEEIRTTGAKSLRAVADEPNSRGISAPRGGRWSVASRSLRPRPNAKRNVERRPAALRYRIFIPLFKLHQLTVQMQVGLAEESVTLRLKRGVLQRAVHAIMNQRQVAERRFQPLAPCNRLDARRLRLAKQGRKRRGAGFFRSHGFALQWPMLIPSVRHDVIDVEQSLRQGECLFRARRPHSILDFGKNRPYARPMSPRRV